MRTVAALLAVILAGALTAHALRAPAVTTTRLSATEACNRVVHDLNAQRGAHGLRGFTRTTRLDRSARAWAATHPTTHGHWKIRLRSYGVQGSWIGEVIAWGYQHPARVVTAWMNSPEHRAVILESHLHYTGAGCVYSGAWWVVADFSGP